MHLQSGRVELDHDGFYHGYGVRLIEELLQTVWALEEGLSLCDSKIYTSESFQSRHSAAGIGRKCYVDD